MQYTDPTRYIALWRPEEPAAPASRHIQVTTRNRARFVLSRPFLASALTCNTKVPVDPAASPNDIVVASAAVKRFGEVIQKVSESCQVPEPRNPLAARKKGRTVAQRTSYRPSSPTSPCAGITARMDVGLVHAVWKHGRKHLIYATTHGVGALHVVRSVPDVRGDGDPALVNPEQ